MIHHDNDDDDNDNDEDDDEISLRVGTLICPGRD